MKLDRGKCFLWVDLRHTTSSNPYDDIGDVAPAYFVSEISSIAEAITTQQPLFLCFDYDQPDKQGLLALQETKRTHAHLPLLMLTEQHSEELAVWALRNRVWDYLVKPLAQQELQHSLRTLIRVSTECRAAPHRHNLHTAEAVPNAQCFNQVEQLLKQKTHPAVAYIEAHFEQSINRGTMAEICRQSESSFSNAFTLEHGTPFSNYLLQLRLTKAHDLLASSTGSIKEIAYAVGFHNTSYFDRAFRRRYGLTPSAYRSGSKSGD